MKKVINAKPIFAVKKLLDKYKGAFEDIVTRLVAINETTPKDVRAKYRHDPYKRKIATYGSKFCSVYNQLDYWYKTYQDDNTNIKAKNQMILWATELKYNGVRYLKHYLND